ncbi:heat shock protein 67B1-like [Schistocerca serialis cubense]|uniref:heat shock protein 67B1-like n=1 Tax=Schistocerca serialis cubense TaxID=2023355 RepID=UPI00214E0382|nr:heat shock protein 67B1-like [Schistocerca serialis cubense]
MTYMLCNDMIQFTLQPPYTGLYEVLKCDTHMLEILMNGRCNIASINRDDPSIDNTSNSSIQQAVWTRHAMAVNDFIVQLDIKAFCSNDLSIKLFEKFLLIGGQHPEYGAGNGFIRQHFTRSYELPNDGDMAAITLYPSPNGFSTITVPRTSQPSTIAVKDHEDN